uniref:Uncharacterized protein n=1 Tax=Anguilla anguilla TaxID=7936 RepID=A0A0E9QT93_ANGAN
MLGILPGRSRTWLIYKINLWCTRSRPAE